MNDAVPIDDCSHWQNVAYAEGRADQREDDIRLLAWAYLKLLPFSWQKQEDALAMDEIKLMLEGAQ